MEIKYIEMIKTTTPSFKNKEVELADFNSSLYLKSIGFNKPTMFYYSTEDIFYRIKGIFQSWKRINHNKHKLRASAPTKRQIESFLNTKLNNE